MAQSRESHPPIALSSAPIDTHLLSGAVPCADGRLPAAEKYLGDDVDAQGRVVGWEGLANHVRHEVFHRMGFTDQETVALLCGGHVYGRCHPRASGYAGPWVEHPTHFSNEYACTAQRRGYRPSLIGSSQLPFTAALLS